MSLFNPECPAGASHYVDDIYFSSAGEVWSICENCHLYIEGNTLLMLINTALVFAVEEEESNEPKD